MQVPLLVLRKWKHSRRGSLCPATCPPGLACGAGPAFTSHSSPETEQGLRAAPQAQPAFRLQQAASRVASVVMGGAGRGPDTTGRGRAAGLGFPAQSPLWRETAPATLRSGWASSPPSPGAGTGVQERDNEPWESLQTMQHPGPRQGPLFLRPQLPCWRPKPAPSLPKSGEPGPGAKWTEAASRCPATATRAGLPFPPLPGRPFLTWKKADHSLQGGLGRPQEQRGLYSAVCPKGTAMDWSGR